MSIIVSCEPGREPTLGPNQSGKTRVSPIFLQDSTIPASPASSIGHLRDEGRQQSMRSGYGRYVSLHRAPVVAGLPLEMMHREMDRANSPQA